MLAVVLMGSRLCRVTLVSSFSRQLAQSLLQLRTVDDATSTTMLRINYFLAFIAVLEDSIASVVAIAIVFLFAVAADCYCSTALDGIHAAKEKKDLSTQRVQC